MSTKLFQSPEMVPLRGMFLAEAIYVARAKWIAALRLRSGQAQMEKHPSHRNDKRGNLTLRCIKRPRLIVSEELIRHLNLGVTSDFYSSTKGLVITTAPTFCP